MGTLKSVAVNKTFPAHLLPGTLAKATMYPKNHFQNLTSLTFECKFISKQNLYFYNLIMPLTVEQKLGLEIHSTTQ